MGADSEAPTGDAREALPARMGDLLHQMAQPLTALLCRLELGALEEQSQGRESAAWMECRRECVRLSNLLNTMRELLQEAQ